MLKEIDDRIEYWKKKYKIDDLNVKLECCNHIEELEELKELIKKHSCESCKIEELKTQIEKMKCCCNCKHDYENSKGNISDICYICNNKNKWELKS